MLCCHISFQSAALRSLLSCWWGDGNHYWKAIDLSLDRKGCKRGEVVLYYSGQLSSTHRKDYSANDLESWLQVKFSNTEVLFSVIYRPLDIGQLLQETGAPLWRNSPMSSFILLGDLKYGFSTQNSFHFTSINTAKKLFNMDNVMTKDARRSLKHRDPHQTSLSRKEMASLARLGLFHPWISDNHLVFATYKIYQIKKL